MKNLCIAATILLLACSKSESAGTAATPQQSAAPDAGQPDFKEMRARRDKEIRELSTEIPAESAGAESAEAAARAFVLAVSKSDAATMKSMLLSLADIRAIVRPDMHDRAKKAVAEVLWKTRRKPAGVVTIVSFEPGELRVMKAGERGFTRDVPFMRRSRLNVEVAGRKGRLRFRAIVRIGERWKIAEL
jgi:hypothetical protein